MSAKDRCKINTELQLKFIAQFIIARLDMFALKHICYNHALGLLTTADKIAKFRYGLSMLKVCGIGQEVQIIIIIKTTMLPINAF